MHTQSNDAHMVLLGLIAHLQHRVAKLEGYSDEVARDIARAVATGSLAAFTGDAPTDAEVEMNTRTVDTMLDTMRDLYRKYSPTE